LQFGFVDLACANDFNRISVDLSNGGTGFRYKFAAIDEDVDLASEIVSSFLDCPSWRLSGWVRAGCC
jgi:hypothetical protein